MQEHTHCIVEGIGGIANRFGDILVARNLLGVRH